MAEFITNLKGNSFLFMCIITGALLMVMFTKSEPPMAYLSGLIIGWVMASLLGVNLDDKQK